MVVTASTITLAFVDVNYEGIFEVLGTDALLQICVTSLRVGGTAGWDNLF